MARGNAPGPAPADHGKRNLWLAITGGTLLAVAVVVGIALSATAPPKPVPTEQVSKPPVDPLDNGTVPDVEALGGFLDSTGTISFSWDNPQPKPGDVFKWRVFAPGETEGAYQSTTSSNVQVKPNPSGTTCIKVMLVRSDGSSSPMEEEDAVHCVPNN
jgi:hypothetical protein